MGTFWAAETQVRRQPWAKVTLLPSCESSRTTFASVELCVQGNCICRLLRDFRVEPSRLLISFKSSVPGGPYFTVPDAQQGKRMSRASSVYFLSAPARRVLNGPTLATGPSQRRGGRDRTQIGPDVGGSI